MHRGVVRRKRQGLSEMRMVRRGAVERPEEQRKSFVLEPASDKKEAGSG